MGRPASSPTLCLVSPENGAPRAAPSPPPAARPSILPPSSEAHDEVCSQQLFSLRNLSLIPPEGRGFSLAPLGEPG